MFAVHVLYMYRLTGCRQITQTRPFLTINTILESIIKGEIEIGGMKAMKPDIPIVT